MDLFLGKNLSIKLKVLTVSISLLLVACGGGGSGTSENVNSPEDKPVVDAGEGLTKVNEFRVLDVGGRINSARLFIRDLESFCYGVGRRYFIYLK